MEQELDLLQYWEVLKKRWILVVSIPILAGLISGIISFYVLKPVYQASTTLIVGKKTTDNGAQQQLLDYSVLMANQQLAKTYGAIVKSRTVEENVIRILNLSVKPEVLDNNISVDQVKSTEVLEISILDQNPYLAAQIANAITEEFSQKVIEIKKVDSVSILDKAVPPDKPVKPNKELTIFIAFAVGFMISMGLVFLLEFLDNTLRTQKDVEKILGLPVLGSIPYYKINSL
ncbi:MAG: putative capsular polysaccharide biosynthesis protein YwqC [Candidatus Dichloromethanomonas elyunquensis]|nr:MAG: putative capsular polysaccharide biosynthesis protein YwqC [Candidatus Dichloromethanomonas elyunquensis]